MRPFGSPGTYWNAKRDGTQPPARPVQARPVGHLVPTYASSLPRALSLGQPAFRAMDELNGDDPAEHGQPEHVGTEASEDAFDPMAEPAKFYQNFKERVATLRTDVVAEPRPLEPARPAITATSLRLPEKPPPPPVETVEEPEPETQRLPLPDPSTAVYLTGIPSWEESLQEWEEPLHLT